MEFIKNMEIKQLSYYINQAKIIKPENNQKKIRIAFVGSFSLNGFEETIQVQCDNEKINCTTYNSPYNQFSQEILNENSDLYKFKPDIVFLLIDNRIILEDSFYFSNINSENKNKKYVNEKINEIKNLIEIFTQKTQSKIIIANFLIPTYTPLGIYESKIEYGIKEIVLDLNKKLKELSRNIDSCYIYDYNSFVAKFGEKNVLDYKKMNYGDIKINFDIIPYLIYDFLGYVKPILGLNKKCLVLDLDNTLWGNIIGEDGFEGIKIGPYPEGRSFVEFQKVIKAISENGIILAINSKNNQNDAMKAINEHPHMILREKDFSCIKINWDDKISNMKKIAKELNIGLDSIVFFDDDPINRELIRMSLPEVNTIELPKDPSTYAQILRNLNDFNILKITKDDVIRKTMYEQEQNRQKLESSTENLNEYLKKLNIKIKIKLNDKFSISRISQLILKTNQFNLTTKRYQEEEIKEFVEDKTIIVGCSEVEDKFGENGITNVFIIKIKSNEWIIDTFLLSCRVMGRGVEEGVIGKILEIAKNKGIERITATFIPTEKNKPSENFLKNYGFEKNGKEWIFLLKNKIKIPDHLQVELL
jgi:FkbH-like protein